MSLRCKEVDIQKHEAFGECPRLFISGFALNGFELIED